jgi:outer membrane lipoprotein-sorting protein
MRNRILAVVLAGVAVSAPTLALAAQDTEKGTALLADARKAIGGDERLRALKTVQVKGTFKRSAGNNTLEGDFEVFLEPPGRYRRNETTGNAGGPIGERVEAMNGTEVWQDTSSGFPTGRGGFGGGGRGGFGGGRRDGGNRAGGAADGPAGTATPPPAIDPERLREAQLRQRRTEMARLMLMWFLSTDAPVAWVGTAESPEGKADVLEVKPAEGAPTRVFLDATTHVPLMITTTAGFGGGRGRRDGGPGNPGNASGREPGRGPAQSITIETHLAEYKAVNGILLPHLITRGANGQTNEEWEIKSYRINPNLKAGTFTK